MNQEKSTHGKRIRRFFSNEAAALAWADDFEELNRKIDAFITLIVRMDRIEGRLAELNRKIDAFIIAGSK